MKLYEIDSAILDCIDAETGEVLDIKRLNELQLEREKKLEGVACFIKNLLSDAEAIKAEKQALDERESKARNKAEQLKKWLNEALNGKKLSTARVCVSFRRLEVIELDAVFDVPSEYIKTKIETQVDKQALKRAIKAGKAFDGCRLVERQNIQIK